MAGNGGQGHTFSGGGAWGLLLDQVVKGQEAQEQARDTGPQSSGAGQASGFGEGLPIIGSLLNGDGKNQGMGSTSPMPLQSLDLSQLLGMRGGGSPFGPGGGKGL